MKDILNLDGLKLTSADREILSALSILASRYDDVYAPEVEGIQKDIDDIVGKFEKSAHLINKIAKQVAIMPNSEFCKMQAEGFDRFVTTKIKSVTLPKIIADFIRAGKWNLIILISVVVLVAPMIRIILLSLIVFFVEKAIGVNLIEVWPFLGHFIGK